MRDFLYRLCVFFTNLFFPPFAICMIAGLGVDLLLNSCLLLLAIIPSHIHGFYLTCIYFHRRNKVKKGRYPGGPKAFVYSKSILNGGYSDAVVEQLYRRERGLSSERDGGDRRRSYKAAMSQRHSYAASQIGGSQVSGRRVSHSRQDRYSGTDYY